MSEISERAERLEEFKKLFSNADENKLHILSGLIEEAFDCKEELTELKEKIRELKMLDAKFSVIARREKILTQKRASYTNMMSKLCKELCVNNADDFFEGLEDYE